MIFAADVGGTNARLGLFERSGARLDALATKTYPSRQHTSLEEIVERFMAEHPSTPKRACVAIAGPVNGGRAIATNLAWNVDARRLGRAVGLRDVDLINDLEAVAHGLGDLAHADVAVLHPGAPGTEGNRAVIAAGTGLGEAGAYWDGRRHHPFAGEGGHTDFGPRTPGEIELLTRLMARFDRVSYERLLSGSGLREIYEFLRDRRHAEEPGWLRQQFADDPAPVVIVRNALEGRSEICLEAVDHFVSIYGAEAGNLALKVMARGGVWIAGGIAPRIVPRMRTPAFLEAFFAKGRMRRVLEGMAVRVILNDKVGLIGAARYAIR
ncbi:MAG TPA: glucokinase [Methylomirabilota bacterium]|nr:glucokinase [Methylomirabilota bacterium]